MKQGWQKDFTVGIFDQKGMREQTVHMTEARTFQTERRAIANALRLPEESLLGTFSGEQRGGMAGVGWMSEQWWD